MIMKDDKHIQKLQSRLEKGSELMNVQKFITLDELNQKYKDFKAKKKLCHYYDQFFCDYKIYAYLTKNIGGIFFQYKK